MQIKREIEVLRKGFTAPIDITHGTDLINIALTIKDIVIPEGAVAVVYAEKIGAPTKKVIAEIEGNTITFAPEKNFFEVGKNRMQIRVTSEEKSLFSFTIDVNCQKSYLDSDAEEIESQPTLVEQILTRLGKHTYNGIFAGGVKEENGKYILVSFVASEGTELVPDDLIIATDGHLYIVTKIGDEIELERTGVNLGTDKGIELTAESIATALGYTPADEKKLPVKTSQLQNDSGFVKTTGAGSSGQALVSDGKGGASWKTIAVGGGSGGVSSWNDLTDKPFEDKSEAITWDGNEEDDHVSTLSDKYSNMGYFRLTEEVVPAEDLMGNTFTYKDTTTDTDIQTTVVWIGGFAELEQLSQGGTPSEGIYIVTDIGTYMEMPELKYAGIGIELTEFGIEFALIAVEDNVNADIMLTKGTGLLYTRGDVTTPKTTIEWDGSLAEKTTVVVENLGTWVKVSDASITPARVMNQDCRTSAETYCVYSETSYWTTEQSDNNDSAYIYKSGSKTLFRLQTIADDIYEKGIYFLAETIGSDGTTATVYTKSLVMYDDDPSYKPITYPKQTKLGFIKTLDSRFLPDGVTGKEIKGKYTYYPFMRIDMPSNLDGAWLTEGVTELVAGESYQVTVDDSQAVTFTAMLVGIEDDLQTTQIGSEETGFIYATAYGAGLEEILGIRAWGVLSTIKDAAKQAKFRATFGLADDYDLTSAVIYITQRKQMYKQILEKYIPANSVNLTLAVGDWSGEESPYSQTLKVSGIDIETVGIVGVSDFATDEEYQVAMDSQLRKTGQGTGYITIKCYGNKPTIDIPVTISGIFDV